MIYITPMFKKLAEVKYKIGLLVAFAIGLTPLAWFHGHMIVGEEYYALDYGKWGDMFAETWFNRVNFGEYSVLLPFKLQSLFFHFLYSLNFSKYNALLTWHIMLFMIASVGFYCFVLKVFKQRFGVMPYILATMYYAYSPYFLNISVLLSPARIVFAILPLMFLIFYQMLKDPKRSILYTYLLNVVLLVASPIFVNIPQGLAVLIVILLFYLYAGISKSMPWQRVTLLSVLFFVMFLSFNAWWILPTGYKQLSGLAALKSEAATFSTVDRSKTADVVTLFGSWAFREKIFNTPYFYFPYNQWFDSLTGVLIRFTPFILTVLGIFYLTRKQTMSHAEKGIITVVLLTYGIFIFLAKGTNPPFGLIYKALYAYLPGFWMYREPYAKFIPMASFASSVLVVFGLAFLTAYSPRVKVGHLNLLVIILTVGVFLTFAKFYLTGKVIWDVNDGVNRSNVITIPDGWKKTASQWKPGQGYYFVYPPTTMYGYYNWPSGYVGNPWLMLTDAKVLNPSNGYSDSENVQRKTIVEYIWKNTLEHQARFISDCSRYAMSGLIVEKDSIDENYYDYAVKNIQKNFEPQLGFSSDSADIYECSQSQKKVDLLSMNAIVNLQPNDFVNYHFIRPLLGENNRFAINSSDESSYLRVQPDLDQKTNTVTYNFGKDFDQYRKYYLLGNLDNISGVKLDGSTANLKQIDEYLQVIPSDEKHCCHTLNLATKTPSFTSTTQSNIWFKTSSQKVAFDHPLNINDVKIYLNKDDSYLTKLDNFDPNKDYHIQIGLSYATANVPFGISLVQVDRKTKVSRFFVNARILDLKAPANIDYPGTTANFLNAFESSDFYLAIYGLDVIGGYPQSTYVIPKEIGLTEVKVPIAFSLKFDQTAQNLSSEIEDYKELGNSVVLFSAQAESASNALVQLKNSYDPQWRMISLSKSDFDTVANSYSKTSAKIRLLNMATKGSAPGNIEYYSNGWLINVTPQPAYYAIVFRPTVFADVTMQFSLYTFIIASGIMFYLVYRRRS